MWKYFKGNIMKKKIILLVVALMVFATGVSASSLNGDYKGNPIVLVKSEGKILEVDEVPGQIIDGHTMVPISVLRQVGASVTWDPNTYSVNVDIPLSSNNNNLDYLVNKKIAKMANMYKLTQDLSDRVSSFSNYLSLYFDGHNISNPNAFSDQTVNDRLTDIIDHYNLISNKYNSIKGELIGIDLSNLLTAINNNFDAIEAYKKASSEIINWNYYRNIRDYSNSQSNFNSYLTDSNTGFTLSSSASSACSKGYDEYILKVIGN